MYWLISLSGFSAEVEPHLTWAWCVSLFCGFFSALVCLWTLAVRSPKSCMSSLLWAPEEALEGTPPSSCQQRLEAATEAMEQVLRSCPLHNQPQPSVRSTVLWQKLEQKSPASPEVSCVTISESLNYCGFLLAGWSYRFLDLLCRALPGGGI